jgi:PleD family two-component response regulator
MAMRVVNAVRQLALPHPASPVAPFVSISVGAYSAVPDKNHQSETAQTWVAAADKALYRAKMAGRNRAEMA